MQNPWFKRKSYGWGWVPVTWQGWLVLGIYLLVVFGNFSRIDKYSHSASDTIFNTVPVTFVATALMIVVCYATGESPRWQWGKSTKGITKKSRVSKGDERKKLILRRRRKGSSKKRITR